jgi:hypothetical protein
MRNVLIYGASPIEAALAYLLAAPAAAMLAPPRASAMAPPAFDPGAGQAAAIAAKSAEFWREFDRELEAPPLGMPRLALVDGAFILTERKQDGEG